MSTPHYVKKFESGIKSVRTPDASITAKHNAEYQSALKAMAHNEYFSSIREQKYLENEKLEYLRNEKLVPIVIKEYSNTLSKLYPELVFREYFTKLVTESLSPSRNEYGDLIGIWDKDFVSSSKNGIRFMCHAYIRDLGGMKYLKETAAKTGSEYLKKVYNVCLETGKALAHGKRVNLEKEISPANVNDYQLDLSVDSEDEAMLDKNISDLDIEDISNLVKDKVLEVVKDEELSNEKDQELKDSIKEEIKSEKEKRLPMTVNNGDADDVSTSDSSGSSDTGVSTTSGTEESTGDDENKSDKEESTEESFRAFSARRWKTNTTNNIRNSLLKSLTVRCFKTAIKESTGVSVSAIRTREQKDEPEINGLNIYDSFLSGENEDLNYIDFSRVNNKSAIASTDMTNIDTENILEESFAEALGLYTALECAYMIKLINPTERELKSAIRFNLKVK